MLTPVYILIALLLLCAVAFVLVTNAHNKAFTKGYKKGVSDKADLLQIELAEQEREIERLKNDLDTNS